MKKIVIISVYFGEFPRHFDLLLKSIEKNPTIDFLIFTDQKASSNMKNLKYVNISLKDLDKRIKKKLGHEFGVKRPYKCCDFKPAYGVLFGDYIRKYDFWGHSDLDLIFGDIRKFITEEILDNYDKILPLGHLSLYRNTTEINSRYMGDGASCGSYDEVFSNEKSYAFDEWNGIMDIYYKNGFSFYDKRLFADISILRKRFTLALDDKNYNQQVFYWEDGHVYRAFMEGGTVKKDEFVYIHFKQRKYLDNKDVKDDSNGFYICDKGFIFKEKGLPKKTDIKKYNRFRGILYEFIETRFSLLKIKMENVRKRVIK